jgi:hypothetical protein
MKFRLFAFALVAVLPALLRAQETKLVNCRTLEAAGNFIGPDEVLDNNLVCQKVKAGAPDPPKLQPPKPLIGAVISDTEPMSVTEAAKAAEKRIALAKAARAQEARAEQGSAPPASASESAITSAPAPPPKENPEPLVTPAPPPTEVATAPAPAPAKVVSASPTSVAHASASKPVETVNPAAVEISAAPAAAIAIPATPKPATERVVAPEPEPPAEPAPASVPPAAPASRVAEVPAPDNSTGFYDANAGTKVVTVAPPEDSASKAFPDAEPANPSAETSSPSSAEPPTTTAETMAPPDDPNAERERIVQLGAFDKPREEMPDPQMLAHKNSFAATEEDGFQEGQRPECTKNITLGSLQGEKLILGTPGWATRWIEKNQKRMPLVCFSGMPMQGARNYLIVFYTAPGVAAGAEVANPSLMNLRGTPASGVGSFTTSYGSTWHYAYDRNVGVTVNTQYDEDQPHNQLGQVLYATAYSEEGVPVAEDWPEKPKKQSKSNSANPKKAREAHAAMEQVSSELLSRIVQDISKL